MEQDKIVIEHLNLWYGSFQALKDINLRLPANEITAFIGPSGCGKSTLLKSLNRMNDLVEGCRIEGTVTLDGEDIYKDLDVNHLRKRVGMVFQNYAQYPHLTVMQNILFPLENLKGKERPSRQEMRRRALETAPGMPVRETYLYLTNLGETIRMSGSDMAEPRLFRFGRR